MLFCNSYDHNVRFSHCSTKFRAKQRCVPAKFSVVIRFRCSWKQVQVFFSSSSSSFTMLFLVRILKMSSLCAAARQDFTVSLNRLLVRIDAHACQRHSWQRYVTSWTNRFNGTRRRKRRKHTARKKRRIRRKTHRSPKTHAWAFLQVAENFQWISHTETPTAIQK